MSNFSTSEKRVIQAMYKLSGVATINEIARKAEMSWNTAEKTLDELQKKNVVTRLLDRKMEIWRLEYSPEI